LPLVDSSFIAHAVSEKSMNQQLQVATSSGGSARNCRAISGRSLDDLREIEILFIEHRT